MDGRVVVFVFVFICIYSETELSAYGMNKWARVGMNGNCGGGGNIHNQLSPHIHTYTCVYHTHI